MRLLAGLASLAAVATATTVSKVDSLPGYANNNGYSMYSGYLTVNASSDRNIFFFMVEGTTTQARNNVVFWTNGGPGCSGIGGGLFSEMGIFRPRQSGTNITLYDNPWNWASIATVVYVEQPAGVGFSYSGNTADYTVGDARSAQDFWAAIQQWMISFPDYSKNPVWISAESYGGHYAPSTSAYIVQQNLAWSSDSGYQPINFAGILVGNAWTWSTLDNKGAVDQWLAHSVIDQITHDGILATCNMSSVGPLFRKQLQLGSITDQDSESVSRNLKLTETVQGHTLAPHPVLGFKSKHPVYDAAKQTWSLPTYPGHDGAPMTCTDWTNEANLVMSNIDIYFSLGNICLSPGDKAKAPVSAAGKKISFYGESDDLPDSNGGAGCPTDYNPCIDAITATYLNRPEVQAAINVNVSTIPTGVWSMCSSVVNYSYSDLLASRLPQWDYILRNWPQGRYLVFSGSEDLIVPTPGTLYWLNATGYPVTEKWHSWLTPQQETGGYAFTQQGPNNSKLYFATVRGAGHMVPTTQASRAYQMAETFIGGGNL